MPIGIIYINCFGVQPDANTLVELNQATPVYVWARTNYGLGPQLIHLYEIDYVRLWDLSLYWYDCALTKW